MINQRLRDQLTDFYLSLIPMVTINVLWFIASLPIITLIPATGALFYSTNQLAHGKSADWRTFVEGFRVCFVRSWLWGVMNVVVIILLVSNFAYYSQLQASWTPWAQALVITFSFLWLALQVHTFPLLLEQEKPSLPPAMRNSLIALLRRPFHAFGAAILITVLALASSLLLIPAWVTITAALCGYIANRTTIATIRKIGGKAAEPQTEVDSGI